MVRRKKRKAVDQVTMIGVLEHFLNGKIHPFLRARASQEETETVRAEVIDDLLPIISLGEGGSQRFKRSEKRTAVQQMTNHLLSLCKKINDIKAAQGMIALQGEPKINLNRRLQSRAQGIFSWRAGDWKILFMLAQPASLRETIYAHVANGLVSGELARLRRCPYCQTFFIAPQPRMTFCPGHARLYYDRPKQRGHQEATKKKGPSFSA